MEQYFRGRKTYIRLVTIITIIGVVAVAYRPFWQSFIGKVGRANEEVWYLLRSILVLGVYGMAAWFASMVDCNRSILRFIPIIFILYNGILSAIWFFGNI